MARKRVATDPPSPDETSFEAALGRLGEVVDRLEHGELPLEEALALFEEGVGLARRLGEQLDAAEQRVELLVEESGVLATQPFEEPGEEG